MVIWESDIWYNWNEGRGNPDDDHIREDPCYASRYTFDCCNKPYPCMTTVHEADPEDAGSEEEETEEREESPPSKRSRYA